MILGDRGIDEKVGEGFWDAISHRLAERFQAGELTLGIVEAIGAAGSSLAISPAPPLRPGDGRGEPHEHVAWRIRCWCSVERARVPHLPAPLISFTRRPLDGSTDGRSSSRSGARTNSRAENRG